MSGIKPPSAPTSLPPPPPPTPAASALARTPGPSLSTLSGIAKSIPKVPGMAPPGSLVGAIPNSVYTDHIAPAARNIGLNKVLNIPDTEGPKSVPGKKLSPEQELNQARSNRSDPPINVVKTKPVQMPIDNKPIDTQKDSYIGNRIKSETKPPANDGPTVQDAIEGGAEKSISPPNIPPSPKPPAPTPAPAATPAPGAGAADPKPVERPAPGPARTPAAQPAPERASSPAAEKPQKTLKDIRTPSWQSDYREASGQNRYDDPKKPGSGWKERAFNPDAGG